MTTMVHLSDTHFGTELPLVMRAVQAAISDIKPDIITITGDLTQRAQPDQFKATQAFLNTLPAAVKFVIPGNHDIPLYNLASRLITPYSNYCAVFGACEAILCYEDIGIIALDATSRWRHTRGILGHKQVIARIKQARSQLSASAILVVCAHQPLAVAWPEDTHNILINAQQTAKLFADHGVDMILSGHVHVPLMVTTDAYFPSLKRRMILSGAGTAISRRTRPNAPNSFNIIRTERMEEKITIHLTLMEYQPKQEAFLATTQKAFSQSSLGWQGGVVHS